MCVCVCVQVCEREYRQSQAEERCTDEIKFTYAWHLIKSQYKNDIRKGIRLMEGIIYPPDLGPSFLLNNARLPSPTFSVENTCTTAQ